MSIVTRISEWVAMAALVYECRYRMHVLETFSQLVCSVQR